MHSCILKIQLAYLKKQIALWQCVILWAELNREIFLVEEFLDQFIFCGSEFRAEVQQHNFQEVALCICMGLCVSVYCCNICGSDSELNTYYSRRLPSSLLGHCSVCFRTRSGIITGMFGFIVLKPLLWQDIINRGFYEVHRETAHARMGQCDHWWWQFCMPAIRIRLPAQPWQVPGDGAVLGGHGIASGLCCRNFPWSIQ